MFRRRLCQSISAPCQSIEPCYLPFLQLPQFSNKRFTLRSIDVFEIGQLLNKLFCVGLHVGELGDGLVTAVVDIVHAFSEVANLEVHSIVENDPVGV